MSFNTFLLHIHYHFNKNTKYYHLIVDVLWNLAKDTKSIFVVPFKHKCSLLDGDSFWSSMDKKSRINYQCIIKFNKIKHNRTLAPVAKNPKTEEILSGTSHFDLIDELGTKI